MRGTTSCNCLEQRIFQISIHVPLCGGRRLSLHTVSRLSDFNPRPPVRGTTVYRQPTSFTASDFNPRPPVRGTTSTTDGSAILSQFQSTSPCAGDDVVMCVVVVSVLLFQSTSPCAGDDGHIVVVQCPPKKFQSTSPCAGDDKR